MDFDGAGRVPRTGPTTGPATGRTAGRGAEEASERADRRELSPEVASRAAAASAVTAGRSNVAAERGDDVRRGGFGAFVRRWLRRLVLVLVIFLAAILGQMVVYRFVDPPFTPIMAVRGLLGEPVDQRWVGLDRISPHLIRAVVASEDGRFCSHAGVDLGELKAAIDDTLNGRPRGGSTITMQVVKNLFLWPNRSVVRKAVEIPLAFVLDFLWPKRRILEVYLNIAEWGPGVYGAEVVARTAFGKPASRLSAAEAARLAVSLPNPAERDAGDPDRTVERLAARLAQRMRAGVVTGCLR
ncbi:MAG: monofunctional biosynthetic peptidoglycan transglycosylase [Hyphomicrobiaceae bacterium]